jgi:MFS transporter, UMF1 family
VTSPSGPAPIADLRAFERRREQKAWYFYDWANSAYVTTVATVLFAPYLTSVAERAACGPGVTDDNPCRQDLAVLGIAVSPGSLVFYVVTLATVASAIALPVVGAAADRSARKPTLMARYAWAGSAFAAGMVFVAGSDWLLGAVLLFAANICLGASLVVYDALLCEIAVPDERDGVSSRGWALGYLGGGLLLAVNLGMVLGHDLLGVGEGAAVRLSLLSAAVWWAAFTVIPYRGVRGRAPLGRIDEAGGLVRQSFAQLGDTLRDLRRYPVTLMFLVAYLFYNDGIQTVIVTSTTYGDKQLGFSTGVLIATVLVVQFVAFGGALLFGRVAIKIGSKKTIAGGLAAWMVVVLAAYALPHKALVPFLALAVVIGLVLGGTQALSRSFFSQLIPRGREAEYFSLYQACERGTSWLGTLVFGVVHQLTDSYRPAIFAVIVFFVLGLSLFVRVDARRGIEEAGNRPPMLV